MENAPTKNSNESAPDKRDCTTGTMPKRINTVTASILASMLEGMAITGLESVFKQNTTRLAAVIHHLTNRYDWQFERNDIVIGTNDGRTAWITVYWLSQETIAKAFELGARTWIESVKAARAKRKFLASRCKATAAKINASRKLNSKQNPRQSNLWGEI